MSKLTKEIIQEFINRGHFKSEGATRNFISSIKTDEGLDCTQAAAAQVAAKIKGFSIARRLKKDDKVPTNLSAIVNKYKDNDKKRQAPSLSKPSFKRKINNSQNSLERDAYGNASMYPHIFLLENKIRKIILKIFENDGDWWTKSSIVHTDIQNYSKNIQNAEKKYKWVDSRGNHPIYYVNLEHLFKIIEMNWPKFKSIFGDLGHLRTWITESIPVRNLIAHNIKTRAPERNDLIRNSSKICKLIDNSKLI